MPKYGFGKPNSPTLSGSSLESWFKVDGDNDSADVVSEEGESVPSTLAPTDIQNGQVPMRGVVFQRKNPKKKRKSFKDSYKKIEFVNLNESDDIKAAKAKAKGLTHVAFDIYKDRNNKKFHWNSLHKDFLVANSVSVAKMKGLEEKFLGTGKGYGWVDKNENVWKWDEKEQDFNKTTDKVKPVSNDPEYKGLPSGPRIRYKSKSTGHKLVNVDGDWFEYSKENDKYYPVKEHRVDRDDYEVIK